MRVLDTHALVWWLSDPERIPAKTRKLLDASISAPRSTFVSSISIWEVAMLVERGRLELSLELSVWLGNVETLPFLTFVPVDNQIAVRSVQLDDCPTRDPADRIIVATALGLGATLVTADAKLRGYRRVTTAWD